MFSSFSFVSVDHSIYFPGFYGESKKKKITACHFTVFFFFFLHIGTFWRFSFLSFFFFSTILCPVSCHSYPLIFSLLCCTASVLSYSIYPSIHPSIHHPSSYIFEQLHYLLSPHFYGGVLPYLPCLFLHFAFFSCYIFRYMSYTVFFFFLFFNWRHTCDIFVG